MIVDRVVEAAGLSYKVGPATVDDHDDVFEAFARIVAADEGYPQDPVVPLARDDFEEYWLAHATVTVVARQATDGALAGAYTMKPNGVGRAGHVANVGYFVVAGHRGRGLGRELVLHSMDTAAGHGFDALQFNFVFEMNPARRLYERLGFEVIGRVPEVIGDQAVYIYWRKL